MISRVALQDLLESSWRMVLRNRRRYKFVLASLAAGVLGFIVTVNIGDSVQKKMGDHLTLLGGATIVDVHRSDLNNLHPDEYTLEDVRRLKAIPYVMAVAPLVSDKNIEASFGGQSMNARLTGVDPSFWETIMAKCRTGRLLDASDCTPGRAVCVLGEHVGRDLFGGSACIGEKIHIADLVFEVIGVLGGIQGADTQRTVFIPLTTAQQHFTNLHSIQELRVRVKHWDYVEQTSASVSNLLRGAHPGFEKGIRVRHYPERINRVRDSLFLIKTLSYLASLAAVLIGVFGVAYLMLASVIMRTKEIGLRKALGATNSLIRIQFLTEGIIVCTAGTVAGIAAGLLACLVLSAAAELDPDPYVMLWSSFGSLSLMMVVGLIAAYRPAKRASRVHPARAIRFR